MVGNKVLKFLTNYRTARCPENEALANFFVDVEQLQILAEFSVVALFRLLHSSQGGLEGVFCRFNQSINANQLFSGLIAPPVGR